MTVSHDQDNADTKPTARPPASRRPGPAMPMCLIIEDSAVTRALLSTIFNQIGCGYMSCTTLAETRALLDQPHLANEDIGACRFDSILLDQHFPDGKGESLIPLLKAHEDTREARIIMMSGDPDINGQDDDVTILTKPFSVEQVVALVLEEA